MATVYVLTDNNKSSGRYQYVYKSYSVYYTSACLNCVCPAGTRNYPRIPDSRSNILYSCPQPPIGACEQTTFTEVGSFKNRFSRHTVGPKATGYWYSANPWRWSCVYAKKKLVKVSNSSNIWAWITPFTMLGLEPQFLAWITLFTMLGLEPPLRDARKSVDSLRSVTRAWGLAANLEEVKEPLFGYTESQLETDVCHCQTRWNLWWCCKL